MAKKMILDVDDTLWNEVLKYRIDHGFKKNNEAVVDLLKKALRR